MTNKKNKKNVGPVVCWLAFTSFEVLKLDFYQPIRLKYRLPAAGAGATFDWLFFDNSKVINFDD